MHVTTPASPGAEPPRLGRPRDPKCDTAIVAATLELLAEGGYAALTMEAVAARAGVGKATLYRRYPGKVELAVEALATLTESPAPQPGMAAREELVALLESMRRTSDSQAGRIFQRLVGESASAPELMRLYREQVLTPRRLRFRAAVERAVAEGLVRADADVEHVVDLLVGPMAYRNLVRTDPAPGPELAARIVDDVLVGLTPRSTR